MILDFVYDYRDSYLVNCLHLKWTGFESVKNYELSNSSPLSKKINIMNYCQESQHYQTVF